MFDLFLLEFLTRYFIYHLRLAMSNKRGHYFNYYKDNKLKKPRQTRYDQKKRETNQDNLKLSQQITQVEVYEDEHDEFLNNTSTSNENNNQNNISELLNNSNQLLDTEIENVSLYFFINAYLFMNYT